MMWSKLQIFGFHALWSPYYLMFIILLALLYFFITGPWREKLGGANTSKPSFGQQVWFYLGLVILYIIKGSPIDLLSHISFIAHMIQMAFYYLVFPIFIIKGIPVWIWQKIVEISGLKSIIKLCTKPLIAVIMFNFLFSMFHLPVILDFSKSHQFTHSAITTIVLIAAFFMWWPLFSPIKEFQIQKPLLRVLYIFGNGILITPACALIIFSPEPLYNTYTNMEAWATALSLCVPNSVLSGINFTYFNGPEFFINMPILHDQQAGGIIMKILQEIIYGIVLFNVFLFWVRKEGKTIDPIPDHVKY
jgi:putative membrane protein